MKSFRLLPIVIFASLSLFLLKSVGLLTQGSYVLNGTSAAVAQETMDAKPENDAAAALTDSEASAADRASETLFPEGAEKPSDTGKKDAIPVTENALGEKSEIDSKVGSESTEKVVLERLGERRAEIDALEAQMATRMALVDAAEKRLEERAKGLELLEERINALVEEKKMLDDEQFSGIVGMYETMKPKDAAAIFNELSMDVLLRVSTSMSPRKMAPVLAAMTTSRAQELTVKMAEKELEPTLDTPIDDFSSLPKINGN